MRCPECGCEDSKVLRTTAKTGPEQDSVIIRERACKQCNARYHTFECFDLPDIEQRCEVTAALTHVTTATTWLAPVGRHIPRVRDALRLLEKAVCHLQADHTD